MLVSQVAGEDGYDDPDPVRDLARERRDAQRWQHPFHEQHADRPRLRDGDDVHEDEPAGRAVRRVRALVYN